LDVVHYFRLEENSSENGFVSIFRRQTCFTTRSTTVHSYSQFSAPRRRKIHSPYFCGAFIPRRWTVSAVSEILARSVTLHCRQNPLKINYRLVSRNFKVQREFLRSLIKSRVICKLPAINDVSATGGVLCTCEDSSLLGRQHLSLLTLRRLTSYIYHGPQR
jgi:hypothetical protein